MALCPPISATDRSVNGYYDRITAEAMTVVLPLEEITTKINNTFSVCSLVPFDNDFDS